MTPVQKIILNIFQEIAKICDSNNIPYYAIGGTAIGAVRHHGFIPWDDDLDIAIPIEYWDKFIKAAEENLPSNLYIYSSDLIRKYHYIWLKICDKNTTFIEKSEYGYKEAWKGIFVDIMPISGIPDDALKTEKFIKRLLRLDRLNNYLRFPKPNKTIRSYLGRLPFRVLSKVLPYNFFSKKYLLELKKYPFFRSNKTGYVWQPQWLPRLIFPFNYFGQGIFVDFETSKIKVPNKVNEYLTQQFGNFMHIPPENKRQIHDGFIDTCHPYSYYYNKELNLL